MIRTATRGPTKTPLTPSPPPTNYMLMPACHLLNAHSLIHRTATRGPTRPSSPFTPPPPTNYMLMLIMPTNNDQNRDTWTDETVISLLRTSFIFWQRGHTSPDAQVMRHPSNTHYFHHLNTPLTTLPPPSQHTLTTHTLTPPLTHW